VKLHDQTAGPDAPGNDVIPWVERETTIDATPAEVWEAITEEDVLEEWLAPDVELDPVEGGEITVRDGDERRAGTVETLEEGERFAFTWERPGQGESFVEFTIEPVPAGTRVVVVETPIGQAGSRASARAWATRLAALDRACFRKSMTPLVA
jgi:uncharacterized protein YndB with AHSA1/START domain